MHQKPERGKEGPYLVSQGGVSPANTQVQNSSLQDGERIYFCCFKSARLWHFVKCGPKKQTQCVRLSNKGGLKTSLKSHHRLCDFWRLVVNKVCTCGRIPPEPNADCYLPSGCEVVGKEIYSSHPLPTGRAQRYPK